MAIDYNHHSVRASKARLGRRLSGLVINLISALAVVMMLVGFSLLVIGIAWGWFVIGLAALPSMVSAWFSGELKAIPVTKGNSVDAILNSQLLGKLSKNPSPSELAAAIMQQQTGLFYAVRFGITPNFLQQISSTDHSAMQAVWEDAVGVQQQLGLAELSAGPLVYSLVKQFTEHAGVLAHNHMELGDIKKGIVWQKHLQDMSSQYKNPRRTGGIARDWSFGYTPLLSQFGQNISQQISNGGLLNASLESHEEAVNQLIQTFSSGGRQNAVLVGAAGVGKTTVVHSLAEQLLDARTKLPASIKFSQIIMLDSASLISAAPGRGQLEELIMRIFNEAYSAKNIIICLDDAQLFFEEGVGSVDMGNVLLPIIEAGRLRIILTMDEQRYLQIGQRNASMVNALSRIQIAPATKSETTAVMQDQLVMTEYQRKVTFTYQSLAEAYRLSERYVHDLAMPGRAVKLLESAASYAENSLVTINSVQQAIEKTMNVKVSVASEGEERQKLLNLEELIHQRMINQTKAVSVVSDALRRARAGVRNQDRPIGTFLFLGPTGVGKTELSKALADVYFGGEEHLIRLDLNEYVQNQDVSRLIADGAEDPTSLTARVMKQPYSVILLDEIEKAHPNVLTTLLQLLDEGILRDVKNREVSFRDAVVIATSNAGADRIREYIDRGYKLDQFEKQFQDELINSGQFRPEFLNRFDEIVLFTPLGKTELLQVINLIIAGVNKTLALQKVSVEVADDAKDLLVDHGYDPQLGARPMRRVVQRAVENTVAKQMLSGQVAPGSTITISYQEVQRALGVNDSVAPPESPSQ